MMDEEKVPTIPVIAEGGPNDPEISKRPTVEKSQVDEAMDVDEEQSLPNEVKPSETPAMPDEEKPSETTAMPDEVKPSETTALPDEVKPSETTALPDEVKPSETTAMPDEVKPNEITVKPDGKMETDDNTITPESKVSPKYVSTDDTSTTEKNDDASPSNEITENISNYIEEDMIVEQNTEIKEEKVKTGDNLSEQLEPLQATNDSKNNVKEVAEKGIESQILEAVEKAKEESNTKEIIGTGLKDIEMKEDHLESLENVQKYLDETSNESVKTKSTTDSLTDQQDMSGKPKPEDSLRETDITKTKNDNADTSDTSNQILLKKLGGDLKGTKENTAETEEEITKVEENELSKTKSPEPQVSSNNQNADMENSTDEKATDVNIDSEKLETNLTIHKLLSESSRKLESPRRKVSSRSRRDPVVPLLPNLHYLDNETNFSGFYAEYFDSTIYMYRSYWQYVQEEFNIPCRQLPAYKTSFYMNYTPSTQPVVQTSSGRVVKKKEFTPSVPSSHHVARKDHLQSVSKKEDVTPKKDLLPVKKDAVEEKSRNRYRLPLEKFGWKREVVFRSTGHSPNSTADVYYYSPAGKKLRSIREILDALPEDNELRPFHFTFVKELLGFESPLEVSREALSRTLTNCDEDTPKRSKGTPVNRKVFFDKGSSNLLSSSGKSKPEAGKVFSVNGKVKKHLADTTSGVKRTHHEMENKTGSPEKSSNGDLSTSEHHKSKAVASPPVKTKSLTNEKHKKSIGNIKKTQPQHSENKVPSVAGSKHKSTESESKTSSNKKRKLDVPVEVPRPPSNFAVRKVIHSNKNLVNDVSNQFNAMVHLCRYLRVEDLLRVARVNRMFNSAAHSHQLWQVVKLKNSKVRNWSGLADCLTRHGTHTLDMLKMITSADPDENDEIWNGFYKVIGKIHSLKRLELGRVTAAEILNAASNCSRNLTEFSVIAQKLATIDLKLFQGLPNLEILQLRSFESKREHGLNMMNISMLSHMRHLRHLSLTGVKNLKSYPVNVFKDFPPLDSLELGDCTKLDERFPECSLAHLTSLVRLRLEMVQGNMANKFVETIATLPYLKTLELINIDTKKGFDDVFARLNHVEHLLIFPTYITQSSTTNWLVLSGLARLRSSLKFLTWGLTQELLRVTTLFIEQWNAQLNLDDGVSKLDPEELKKTIVESNSIPVMKPLPELFERVHTAGKGEGCNKQNISELDILPIDELKTMLEKVLSETKIKLITVPVSSTTRIYLPNN